MDAITKHTIITGGSSGIGFALAKKLVQKTHHISLISRDAQQLMKAVDLLTRLKTDPGQNIVGVSADVSDYDRIKTAINEVIEISGTPSMLITSAGISEPGYFEELSLESHRKAMDINYFGTLNATKVVVPFMKKAKKGTLVYISSAAGLIGVFGYSAYCPSKFAVRGLAESLRTELLRYGIHLSLVYPPDTNTPQLAKENLTKPIETKKITGGGTIWEPEEVAELILKKVNKGQFHIAPGFSTGCLRWSHSFLFPYINLYWDKIINKCNKDS
ncbi:MAG TPA: SDR family oxidoreductase [Legionella sp.]|nr:SDR family oxidoreductase [Legionella sp.]